VRLPKGHRLGITIGEVVANPNRTNCQERRMQTAASRKR
jgi:hypothetical protein